MAAFGTAITWIRDSPMHFELLVEDQSGRIALEAILTKLLGPNYSDHSWRMHSYKGLGHIPKNLGRVTDLSKRLLLYQLPSLLRAYGRSLPESSSVIVVVDLDDRDCVAFKQDLLNVLKACDPQPNTQFRIAIEESEAWLLGDRNAVKAAYPRARDAVLKAYVQDSICGTWEVLADAVYSGGATRLKRSGYQETGKAKCEWAKKIAHHIDVDKNLSKSFQVFRDGVRNLASIS